MYINIAEHDKQPRVGFAVALLLFATACTTVPNSSAPPMILGAQAPPPSGFLQYCMREPGECADPGRGPQVEPAAAAAISRRAGQMMWQAALEARSRPADTVPASGGRPEAPPLVTLEPSGRYDWSRAFAAAHPHSDPAAPIAEVVSYPALAPPATFQITPPARIPERLQLVGPSITPDLEASPTPETLTTVATEVVAPTVAPVRVVAEDALLGPIPLTPALWASLTAVNNRINRAIIRATDMEVYGVEDYWATPLEDGTAKARGDCEDYVLEKRRALVAAGVPESALSIAVATTPWGEGHALLLVSTMQSTAYGVRGGVSDPNPKNWLALRHRPTRA